MAFVSKAGSSGPSPLLACFDDLASLSRAEPLARDLTRLAAAEAALPTALSQASEQAGAALIRLVLCSLPISELHMASGSPLKTPTTSA